LPGDVVEISWGHDGDGSFGIGFVGIVSANPKAFWEGSDRGVRILFHDGIPYWFSKQWNKAYFGNWNAWDSKWEDSAPWTAKKIAKEITEAMGFRFLAGQGLDLPEGGDVSVGKLADDGAFYTETYTESRSAWEWLMALAQESGFRPPKVNGIDLYWNPTQLHRYLETELVLTHSNGLLKNVDPVDKSEHLQEPTTSEIANPQERSSEYDYQLETVSLPLLFGGAIFEFEANKEEILGFSSPDARKPLKELVQAVELNHVLSVGSGKDSFDVVVKCKEVKG
jgi:hypothetical protein